MSTGVGVGPILEEGLEIGAMASVVSRDNNKI